MSGIGAARGPVPHRGMRILSERIGDTLLITIEDAEHKFAFPLSLAEAVRVGTALIAQTGIEDDGLELPESLRLRGGAS